MNGLWYVLPKNQACMGLVDVRAKAKISDIFLGGLCHKFYQKEFF